MTKFLKYEQDGGIVTLTMNDPDRRNPLTGNSAVEEFLEAADRIEKDASVRVVIVTGSGKAFSAGGDVKDMKKYEDDTLRPISIRTEYQQGIQRLTLAMYNLEVPMIAAVNGYAIGAGCDLTCMCDIRIAGESAKFAESFIKVGLIPGDGGAWLLPRVVGMSKAAEMAFTGEMLDANAALACGLVSRVVPDDQLLAEVGALAAKIAANPGPTLRMTKRLLKEGQVTRLSSLLELSASYQALAHKTAEHAEAVNAFIDKRKPEFG
ncbi:crotonase/enoyl-CoA hydratase family protein [Sulfitobacter faviae]|uniref:crotonase/enoyl-CoA hydratase family protein n=1 Tax=Sulfitobacter faviae TaxID=1775881 RepID=UPI00398D237E